MNQRRKVTLAVLFVMTVLLAGVSIFITLRIQQNNAANDANASGFGATATKDLYDDVQSAFAQKPCERFFGKDFVNSDMGLTKDDIISTTGIAPSFVTPKDCTYNLSNNRSITFRLVAYNTNSYIDPDAQALYNRIGSIYQKDELGYLNAFDNTIFVGNSIQTTGACDALLYNNSNDFEYALIEFKGFGDCSTLVTTQAPILRVFAGNIQSIMVGINSIIYLPASAPN